LIVDLGLKALLTQQLSYLGTLSWGLFTSNTADAEANVLATYTEAAFSGYARQAAGAWAIPTLATPRWQTIPGSGPVFSNTSGSPQTVYGWLLIDPVGPTLVAATNFGAVVIPSGMTLTLAPVVTDRQE
jgi:hypothetical protein